MKTAEFFLADCRSLQPEDLECFFLQLSKKRKAEIAGYRSLERRRSALCTERLLEIVAERMEPENKGQFETVRQENRKLTIKNFSYCLSNSSDSGFAAVLITEEEAGMDLMKVRRADPQMIERICSAKQKEWIFKADEDPQNREERLSPAASLRFFQLWTLVEAAYKAQSFEERDSCRSFVLEDLMCSIWFPGSAEQYHLRFWSVDLKEKTVKEKTDKWREQAFPQALQSELYFEKLV